MRCYLVTLGCAKNSVDSEMVAELLRQDGHVFVDAPRRAELLIVNTCAFIADARDESLQAVRELAERKKHHQHLLVMGCMAERDVALIQRLVPGVDAFIGARAWPLVRQAVAELAATGKLRGARVSSDADRLLVSSVTRSQPEGASAYLKIADGCDASCGYCAIPLIKGPQHSKEPHEVLHEARELADWGVHEISVIAQDTTAYGRDLGLRDGLAALLCDLSRTVPEVAWLRVLYAYPQHITPGLIEWLATAPNACHYLDIPLQHGSSAVLKRMRRPYDTDAVFKLVDDLRRAIPDIALRSTYIVGYPGESEAEFDELLELMRVLRFDHVGVFRYSRERGTYADTLPDQVTPELAQERFERAMELQQGISYECNQLHVGRELPVLVEGVGEGLVIGRCYRQAPEIDGLTVASGTAQVGELVRTCITGAQEYDLVGQLLGS
ncbi:MAG: 30S ribosomal protein S12 methylthiotransferase RimO [Chloroflexi bacterium]|nr:30S ribosomal protein S12 methylthiotransferase RimO [Chloroflexota bacterium]